MVERVIVYDIIEQMTDAEDAIEEMATSIDLSWLHPPYPQPVSKLHLVTADRDLVKEEIPRLIEKYDAVAGDWESGSIAWVADCYGVRCLILRGVSDLVGAQGGEAYGGDGQTFSRGAEMIFRQLLSVLPDWIRMGLVNQVEE